LISLFKESKLFLYILKSKSKKMKFLSDVSIWIEILLDSSLFEYKLANYIER